MIKHLLLIGSLLVSGVACAVDKDEWKKIIENEKTDLAPIKRIS